MVLPGNFDSCMCFYFSQLGTSADKIQLLHWHASLEPCSCVLDRLLASKQLYMLFFQSDETEAILLIDASKAFNSLKRAT